MKKCIVLVAIAALALTSCGTTRNVTYALAPAPSYTPAPVQEQKQPVQQVTTKDLNEAELALLQATTHMRALGASRTYDLATAIDLARYAAITDLAERAKAAAVSASETYLRQVNKNASVDMERINEGIAQRITQEVIGGLKPVAIAKEPFNDGTFNYIICFEMTKSKEELMNNVADTVAETVVDNIPESDEAKTEQHRSNCKDMVKDLLMF